MPGRLPLVALPEPGESLESWIEALCAHAGLTTAGFLWCTADVSSRATPLSIAYLGVKLHRFDLTTLSALTGLPARDIRMMTLERYDRTALHLTGLNAHVPRSLRGVAHRRWAFWAGSRVCRDCAGESPGRWQLRWRLPWVMVCTRHRTVLESGCPTCARTFRTEALGGQDRLYPHRSLLGTCGNPVQGKRCEQHLAALPTRTAPDRYVHIQATLDRALTGTSTIVGDFDLAPEHLFAELRCLAALLIHIAEVAQGAPSQLAPLTEQAAAERGNARAHRWHLSPPRSATMMMQAVDAAYTLLELPPDRARDLMANYIRSVPAPDEGLLAWIGDHTVMTPLATRIVLGALGPRRRSPARL